MSYSQKLEEFEVFCMEFVAKIKLLTKDLIRKPVFPTSNINLIMLTMLHRAAFLSHDIEIDNAFEFS